MSSGSIARVLSPWGELRGPHKPEPDRFRIVVTTSSHFYTDTKQDTVFFALVKKKKMQLQDLNGTVIMIGSRKHDREGDFICAHESETRGRVARIALNTRDSRGRRGSRARADNVDCQWIIHHIRDDIIALESVLYRGHYLNMSTNQYISERRIVNLTCFSDIPEVESAQFKVWGDNLNFAAFQSCRWNSRWLDTHSSAFLLGANGPSTRELQPHHNWGRFSIQPQRELRAAL